MSRLSRLLNAFRTTSLERDFDDELRFHLEERTRQNLVERMAPQDAKANALERFGSVDDAKAGMRAARVSSWPAAALIGCLACGLLALSTSVRWVQNHRVYDLADDITAPAPVAAPRPQYTAAARRAKIQGTVRVRCIVRPDGACSNITVVRSLDSRFGLDQQAVHAIGEWRFRPALLEGKPVSTRIMFDFTFALR